MHVLEDLEHQSCRLSVSTGIPNQVRQKKVLVDGTELHQGLNHALQVTQNRGHCVVGVVRCVSSNQQSTFKSRPLCCPNTN